MSRTLGFVLVVLAAACAPTQTPPAGAAAEGAHAELSHILQQRGYEAVPLQRLATGHFSIQAHAGALPLTLIVDTGAGRTVLDREWAVQAEVPLIEQESTATGLGGTGQRLALATLRDLNIGPVALDTMQVAVLDLSHVNVGLRQAEQMPIQGIIGADFLHTHDAILDYQGPTLYVRTR